MTKLTVFIQFKCSSDIEKRTLKLVTIGGNSWSVSSDSEGFFASWNKTEKAKNKFLSLQNTFSAGQHLILLNGTYNLRPDSINLIQSFNPIQATNQNNPPSYVDHS